MLNGNILKVALVLLLLGVIDIVIGAWTGELGDVLWGVGVAMLSCAIFLLKEGHQQIQSNSAKTYSLLISVVGTSLAIAGFVLKHNFY